MNKTDFKKLILEKIIILDGASGTELQKRGFLKDIGAPEELNLKYPERMQAIYKDYLDAGSDAILTNTFGANRMKLKDYGLENRLEEINIKGVEIAREVAKKYNALVIGDISSLGSYLTPLGPVSFDKAYEAFAEQVRALAKAGVDFIIIETMAEIRELKAALLAAKDNFDGPVMTQMTFSEDGATVTGTKILPFISVAESMGADGLGLNCSVGPKELSLLAKIIAKNSNLPISFKPNAGMPKLINRETVFPGTVKDFVSASLDAYNTGVNMLGGCCGTTPEFIKELSSQLKNKKPKTRKIKEKFLLSSRTDAINIFDYKDVVKIGERINPTGRNAFQDELFNNNFSTIRKEAQEQVKAGANVLDINLGLPGGNEKALMERAVEEIQETVSVPLCLDSSSWEVLEAGLKMCTGKPIINSVNGDIEKLNKIVPLAKRYGAAVIALAVDETGIPKTVEKRMQIAKTIMQKLMEYAVPETDVIFDFLTLSASTMPEQSAATIDAIKQAKKLWHKASFSLGVSNVSFGLPNRQALNSTFLKLARNAGLNMAILNPHEDWSIDDKEAKNLLLGKDLGSKNYINKHSSFIKRTPETKNENFTPEEKLYNAVIDGNREEIVQITKIVLDLGKSPLEISNGMLLKGLNEVGERFSKKEYFLPQIIRSAEAAQTAFSFLKPLLKKDSSSDENKKIVLATVKDDVHDIGKNIVAAVMESHGWTVIDLGKNIDA
ncbi:homocysteine S-methyltransferase family protein, partial [Elusimicrobiota bacterium]